MYNPTRDQAREFFFTAWANYRSGAPLSELERAAVEIIALHPEYQPLLQDRTRNLDRDYPPEDGRVNPFLHLSLHLGVAEQLAVDRPQGVRAEFERLARKHDDRHAALHDVLDCMGEAMWQAQRTGTPPDATLYLDCVRRK